MSEGIVLLAPPEDENDGKGWRCSCGEWNRSDASRCEECDQKEDENDNYQIEGGGE